MQTLTFMDVARLEAKQVFPADELILGVKAQVRKAVNGPGPPFGNSFSSNSVHPSHSRLERLLHIMDHGRNLGGA